MIATPFRLPKEPQASREVQIAVAIAKFSVAARKRGWEKLELYLLRSLDCHEVHKTARAFSVSVVAFFDDEGCVANCYGYTAELGWRHIAHIKEDCSVEWVVPVR